MRRPVVHYSRYVSPQWLLGCSLIRHMDDVVAAELRSQHSLADNAAVTVVLHGDEAASTTDKSAAIANSGGIVNPLDPRLRSVVNLAYLLTKRLYLPPSSVSPNAWQSSLILFRNATTLLGNFPSMSDADNDGKLKLLRCALSRYYDDTSAAHLVRNCSQSGGALWKETLLMYQAMHDIWTSNRNAADAASAVSGEGVSSASGEMTEVFPDGSLTQSKTLPLVKTAPLHVSRLFTRPNPPVLRSIRLMTLTTLLDAGQWAAALTFTTHALLSRDFPSHMAIGYLLRVLGEASRWQEALHVTTLALNLVETRNVAILSTTQQLQGQTNVPLTKERAPPDSETSAVTDAADSNSLDRWLGTLHTGLKVVAQHGLDAARQDVKGNVEMTVNDIVPPNWAALVTALLRRSEAATAFTPVGTTAGGPSTNRQRMDSKLMFMIDQLQALTNSQTIAPMASNQKIEQLSHSLGRTNLTTNHSSAAVFAAARGAAMSGDWLAALRHLSIQNRTHSFVANNNSGEECIEAATVRVFILDAMPKGTLPSAMLRLRSVLDATHPYATAPQSNALDIATKQQLNVISMREKEAIIVSCASSRLPLVPGDWKDALTLLAEPLRYPDAPPVLVPAVHGSTPQSIGHALWVPGLPWSTALALFQASRTQLLVAEAKTMADASSAAAADETSSSMRHFTKSSDQHEGVYTSAMMHLAENLAHFLDSTNTTTSSATTPPHRAAKVLDDLLRDLLHKSCVSPSAALLASRTSSQLLLGGESDNNLLQIHGSVLSPKVLFYALTTKSPRPLSSQTTARRHRISSWETGMKYVALWARQTARKLPERSDESVWSTMPCFPILAALDRLSNQAQERSVGDVEPPSNSWELALGVWKWTRNSQPGAIQKANHASSSHKPGRAAEQVTLIALKTASVLLQAADRTGSPQPANAACRLLFDILHRHKLKSPVHCFSPATLDQILPTTLFSLLESPRPTQVLVLQRAACLRTCLEAVLRRIDDATPCVSHMRHSSPSSPPAAEPNCQEGLFQCVKMASRASRLVSEYQRYRQRQDAQQQPPPLQSQNESLPPSRSAASAPPTTSSSPIPAGGTQSLPDFARSIWLVALVAASTAIKLAKTSPQLPETRSNGVSHGDHQHTNHPGGGGGVGGVFRPQLLEHLIGTAAPSPASHQIVRDGVRQAILSGMPVSAKAAGLIVQHGYWSSCLDLIARQHRDAILSSLTNINPDAAMKLLDSL